MGASSSTPHKSEVSSISTLRCILPYDIRKKKFVEGNKQFAVNFLAGPFAEELPLIEEIEASQMKGKLSALYNKYKKDLTKNKINENTFNMRVRELYVESIIKKKMFKENFDIFKFIGEKYTELNIGACDSKAYKDAIYIFEKEFDIKLTMITYSLLDIANLNLEDILALNRHLKFNLTYMPNVFNVILTDKLLTNKELIDDLCDLIGNGNSIKILTLILYPKNENGELPTNYGLTCSTYKALFSIMRAVNRNKSIKGLFMHCIKDYDISLAPEIFDRILKKLQTETLIAFHFGNFKLSEGLLNKLLFQIGSTRCLKFLSLHLPNTYKLINKVLLQALIKNVSLYAFAVTNLNNKNDKKEIVDFKKSIDEHIKEENNKKSTNIKVYYVGEQSLLNLVFEK